MASPTERKCQSCGKIVPDGYRFCGKCGARVGGRSLRAVVAAAVADEVAEALEARLSTEEVLVRSIADKIEDVLWKRLRVLISAIGILALILTIYGIKTFEQLDGYIRPALHQAQEQSATAVVEAVAAATKAELSLHEVDSVQDTVRRTVDRAQNLRTKVADLSVQLIQERQDVMRTLSSVKDQLVAVQQLSDELAIARVYPGLGKKSYVQLAGASFSPPSGAKVVHIYVAPEAVSRVSTDTLKTLMSNLSGAGFTPILGSLTQMPANLGFIALNNIISEGTSAQVSYFRPDQKVAAKEIEEIAAKTFTFSSPEPVEMYFPSKDHDALNFIISKSALVAEIYIQKQ